MSLIAIPVCRRTRWRILRMAAESSTTKMSDSMGLLYSIFIGWNAGFLRRDGAKVPLDPADYHAGPGLNPHEPATIPTGDRCGLPELADPGGGAARRSVRFPASGSHPEIAD